VSGHSCTDAIKFLHLNTLFFFFLFFFFFPSLSFFFSQPRVVCFGFTLFFFLSSSFSSPPLTHTHTHTFCPRFFSISRTIGSRFQDLTFHFLEDLESVKKLVGAGSKFRECQCANLSLSLSLSHHTKIPPPTAFVFLPDPPPPTISSTLLPSFTFLLPSHFPRSNHQPPPNLPQIYPNITPKTYPDEVFFLL
jgi:hypothetical protein